MDLLNQTPTEAQVLEQKKKNLLTKVANYTSKKTSPSSSIMKIAGPGFVTITSEYDQAKFDLPPKTFISIAGSLALSIGVNEPDPNYPQQHLWFVLEGANGGIVYFSDRIPEFQEKKYTIV